MLQAKATAYSRGRLLATLRKARPRNQYPFHRHSYKAQTSHPSKTLETAAQSSPQPKRICIALGKRRPSNRHTSSAGAGSYNPTMSDVTRILSQIESGDPIAADQLLPLVYRELRQMAAAQMTREKPGQTLQATALVHEAYLRLLGHQANTSFANCRCFFAAAAEAMRRILIEQARRKQSVKRGGDMKRQDLDDLPEVATSLPFDLVGLSEALDRLAARDPQAAELVKLKFFAGLTTAESANLLEISERSTERLWVYAKSFLHKELSSSDD
jgi:RNA polymerase sigma factor (TIGR02999 family)